MLSGIQAYHAAFRFTGSPICQPGAAGEILLEPGQELKSEGFGNSHKHHEQQEMMSDPHAPSVCGFLRIDSGGRGNK